MNVKKKNNNNNNNKINFVFLGETDNWALGKPAYQSTQLDAWRLPDHAVDGDYNCSINNNKYTHTAVWDTAPWWLVDLERSILVTEVKVFNRQDCCCRYSLKSHTTYNTEVKLLSVIVLRLFCFCIDDIVVLRFILIHFLNTVFLNWFCFMFVCLSLIVFVPSMKSYSIGNTKY